MTTTKTLSTAIAAAHAADDAFALAITAAGYKSRWDLPAVKPPAVLAAYQAKVAADAAMHAAFETSRRKFTLV